MLSAIRTTLLALALTMTGIVASAVANDDRPPTGEERMAIEGALRNLGFSTWEEIEFDDGKWEIDDAVHSDGKKYDVQLEPGSLNLIKQSPDD